MAFVNSFNAMILLEKSNEIFFVKQKNKLLEKQAQVTDQVMCHIHQLVGRMYYYHTLMNLDRHRLLL